MIKVSVIMPVYNTEKYLSEAIQSILDQSYTNFELIIIDDGSSDNSYIIAKSFAVKDSRIVILKNDTNQGVCATTNLGLKHARGQYIARMDSDDISHPERLQRQVDYLDNNLDVGGCGTFCNGFINTIDNVTAKYILNTTHEMIRIQMLIFSCAIIQSTIMLRKQIFDNYQLKYNEDLKAAEDYELFIKILANGIRVINLPECLFYYRERLNQSTRVNRDYIINIQRKLLISGLKLLFKNELNDKVINDHMELMVEPKNWCFVFKLYRYYKHLKLLKLTNQKNKTFAIQDFEHVISRYYILNKIKHKLTKTL